MSDNPQTPGVPSDSDPVTRHDLPTPAVPVARPAAEDPDLPRTAREVAVSIAALVAEVRQLNERLEANAVAAELLDTRMSKGERAHRRVTVALTFIAVLFLAVVFLGYQVYDYADCQAEQNDVFRNSTIQSRIARDFQDDRQIGQLDQQIKLFDTILNPASTAEERRNAQIAYKGAVLSNRDAVIAAKQTRQDHPIPTGNCS